MKKLIAAVVVLLVGVALVYEFAGWYSWVGGFDLAVHVDSPAGRPQSVTCEAVTHPDEVMEALHWPAPPGTRAWSASADPFDGRPLTVSVKCIGRTSPSGRELSYAQLRCLLVVATFADGRRVHAVVDIPDGRIAREVRVVLPAE